jgi:hypothetical protein
LGRFDTSIIPRAIIRYIYYGNVPFIGYVQSQKIGNPNNEKASVAGMPKGLKK